MGLAEPRDAAAPLTVTVVHCAGRGLVDATVVSLPAGSTVAAAVEASGVLERHPGLALSEAGLWGRPVAADRSLRHGDRVELYRPLQVDPMEARRSRHREQKRARARRPAPAG